MRLTFFLDFFARLRSNLGAMPSFSIIKELLLASEVRGSKSTALEPLLKAIWTVLAAMFIIGMANRDILKLPSWTIIVLFGVFILFVVALLCCYFLLLYKDRDALRSEKFVLRKMEIERGPIGDSIHGKILLKDPQLQDQENLKELPAADSKDGDDREA